VGDPSDDSLPPDIQALEREAHEHPDSEWRQSRLVGAFCTDELHSHRRRIELILDYISRFPRSVIAKSPAVHADPIAAPEAFASIDALWLRLRNEDVSDPDLAIGHAALVANQDRSRAAEILRATIALLPKNADLWTELGRIAAAPSEQLDALNEARALGASQPNLLVWIGRTAVDAGRSDEVYNVGCELMARAHQTRATIQPIAWTDTGRAAWSRIRSALESSPERSSLIHALGQYANDLHWAHTFLGLVAAEQGQLLEAGKHLLSSLAIWGEPRLTSYGPSFHLARKLCETGLWTEVEEFLVACEAFWDDEVLDEWIEAVRNEKVPDFDDA
jgi:tetratricopeptide (TPR) repeat protein